MGKAEEFHARRQVIDDKIAALDKESAELVAEYISVGATIHYARGTADCVAKVIDVFGDRIKVRGRSGAEYWLDSYRVTKIR